MRAIFVPHDHQAASRYLDMEGELVIGVNTVLQCPLPTYKEMATLTGYSGSRDSQSMRLQVHAF